MAIIAGGNGTVLNVGNAASAPLHASLKPNAEDGHYALSVVTQALTATLAGSAIVFAARWTHATKTAKIRRVELKFLPLTPFTAATLSDHTSFDLLIGRTFTANYSGGTALTLTGNSCKLRSSYPTTQFGEIRVATTAAFTGGTITLDPHPIMQTLRRGNRVNPAAATEEVVVENGSVVGQFSEGESGHPIILSQNEGLIVRNRTVWPAAGTGILCVSMVWSEGDFV
jgi:hypothetical protein